EEGKGFKIMSVRAGSPAEKAGLKGGDLLISLGGKAIANIYDYTYALQEFRPGDEAEAVVIREGSEVKVRIVFGARKAAE
ncbi:MAG TPA: PDZ domain-containing protein, partial [Acidobacteriota bacterium]|nr:PDZ domain-containing protein [Acidobacteriota bacterium]